MSFSCSVLYTVDGWNPAPVELGSLSHYLQGFIHPRCLAAFLPSTVSYPSALKDIQKTMLPNFWKMYQIFEYSESHRYESKQVIHASWTPSRELNVHIPFGKWKSSTQNCLFRVYVSFRKGMTNVLVFVFQKPTKSSIKIEDITTSIEPEKPWKMKQLSDSEALFMANFWCKKGVTKPSCRHGKDLTKGREASKKGLFDKALVA